MNEYAQMSIQQNAIRFLYENFENLMGGASPFSGSPPSCLEPHTVTHLLRSTDPEKIEMYILPKVLATVATTDVLTSIYYTVRLNIVHSAEH